MLNNAAFTICAKNYLAQAFTLRESFKKNNLDSEFYIFLSDDLSDINNEEEKLCLLHDSWIPNWRQMAFKYNVIEFSTSIKPFCFKKLFCEGFEKVIYLDPDIYVINPLDEIYDYLDEKVIVLSPHYCNIQTEYTGSITEEEILFVGIYNLGFTAICNNLIGNKIVDWWMNRLENKCYADKFDALHVDQKWIDFIPAFFPNDTLITHHLGINPAIWNLHERELVISGNGEYKIRCIDSKKIFPLLFFHFSGFDPFKPTLINRRHPQYNTDVYPSYIPLFESYINDVYKNGYDRYSKMKYSFNSFKDGEIIIPLQRRLFRVAEMDYVGKDPFDQFVNVLRENKLMTGIKSSSNSSLFSDSQMFQKSKIEKIIIKIFKILKFLIGVNYYSSLIGFLNNFTRLEKQTFLIRK